MQEAINQAANSQPYHVRFRTVPAPIGIQADLTHPYVLPAIGTAAEQVMGSKFKAVVIDYPWAIEMKMK